MVIRSKARARWRDQALRRRARRALIRQLAYQERKARAAHGREQDFIAAMSRSSQEARDRIESLRPISPNARVLEVGSGAHGLIFFFGGERDVGIDPLAVEYASLFPAWQRRAATVAALGEQLPFRDSSFDVVLCDNVVDHAERPAGIVAEIARVLAPAGALYFTVNVHHPVYALAASMHAAWTALGVPFEIGPFADHTVHLTPTKARRLFDDLPLRILHEHTDIAEAKAKAKQRRPRHAGDRLKRIFFKNALLEIIAIREPA